MRTFIKAVPCVLKDLDESPKILAFIHPPPLEDFQIPKGTVEAEESIRVAVLRELYEESGIQHAQIMDKIGRLELITPSGPNGGQAEERQYWEVFHIAATVELPDQWNHTVSGDGVDEGMTFRYFWHDLSASEARFHPKFQSLLALVRNYIQSRH